jgi:antibiotic biosynthesis monooxygenase (ABM) superfamily enzyme
MNRRTCLTALLAAGVGQAVAETQKQPVELHLDLSVDPGKEKEMLKNFHTVFQPAARQQPGFIDTKLLKLNSTLQGTPPAGANYRFMISFQNEELRKKWVDTAVHKRVWPTLENTLRSKDYTILLYDVS